MTKSVLFYYKNGFDDQKGGVQSVSLALACEFIKNDYRVYFLSEKAYKFGTNVDIIHILLSSSPSQALQEVIELFRQNRIDFVINQEGLSNRAGVDMLKIFGSGDTKLISFIHNDPTAPIHDFAYRIFRNGKIISTSWLSDLLTYIYFLRNKKSYQDLLRYSWKTIVLSHSYALYLSRKCDIPVSDFMVLPNPVKYNNVALRKKQDRVLYVGRLNVSQKRLDLLLRIWGNFELKYDTASLSLIGEGCDTLYLKKCALDLCLRRVKFLGRKDPSKDYAESKVLCLTSAFEGFPLVLYEALKFRVVPIVFNTFSSASDIIIDGFNGRLIEPGCEDKYLEAINEVLANYTQYAKNIEAFQAEIPTVETIYNRLHE